MGKADNTAQLERLVDQQRALLAVNRAVSANLDRSSLIGAIEESVGAIIPMDIAGLLLPGEGPNDFHVYASYGVDDPEFDPGKMLKGEPAIVGEAASSGQIMRVSHAAEFVERGGDGVTAGQLGLESALMIPLPCNTTTPLGMLVFASPRPGRFDHVDLSFAAELADIVAAALRNTLAYEENLRLKDRLAAENEYLKESLSSEGVIVGVSRLINTLREQISRVASSDTTVLITGETGTGKELVADEIYRLSRRSDKLLVKINCAALAGGIAESELFGHVKGAFTDANSDRKGRFAVADGGTLFLDEVGELPLPIQAALLRTLQQGEIEPVGAKHSTRVDVRVIAATHRDLSAMIDKGTFRRDLYYRLNVFSIRVPPLREHRDDIRLLAEYFLHSFAARVSKSIERFSDEALAELRKRDWPGNVRELQNVVQRAAILATGPIVELRAPAPPPEPPTVIESSRLVDVERDHVEQVLISSDWVVAGPEGAADKLGINPSTLRSRMRKLGIKRPDTAEQPNG